MLLAGLVAGSMNSLTYRTGIRDPGSISNDSSQKAGDCSTTWHWAFRSIHGADEEILVLSTGDLTCATCASPTPHQHQFPCIRMKMLM